MLPAGVLAGELPAGAARPFRGVEVLLPPPPLLLLPAAALTGLELIAGRLPGLAPAVAGGMCQAAGLGLSEWTALPKIPHAASSLQHCAWAMLPVPGTLGYHFYGRCCLLLRDTPDTTLHTIRACLRLW